MEAENTHSSTSRAKCYDCGGFCPIGESISGICFRSVKRKHDEFEGESQLAIQGYMISQNPRVDTENECLVLREMVTGQQQAIQDLISELEEERNAAASAASEAMSMILRLQSDKAEIQMEARQFKRLAEEKMSHNQHEALILEDLLYKRDQTIQSLTCEVQAYRHRMMSYGLAEPEVDGGQGMSQNTSINEFLEGPFELPLHEVYPQLKCNTKESHACPTGYDETTDMEKYVFDGTPRSQDQLRDLEYRIFQIENSQSPIYPDEEMIGMKNVLEKVIVGQSPRRSRHLRKFSTDSTSSPLAMNKEVCPDIVSYSPQFSGNSKKTEFSILEQNYDLRKMDNTSEIGDELVDRVYNVDSVFQGPSINYPVNPSVASSRIYHPDARELEIQKLYARLHALEADRESMRQAIVSFGSEKAQMALLKEIAQNLCKEMSPTKRMPVRKQPRGSSFSLKSIFKWFVESIIFWRKSPQRCRYMFDLSVNNVGLLILLVRDPQQRSRRYIFSTNLLGH